MADKQESTGMTSHSLANVLGWIVAAGRAGDGLGVLWPAWAVRQAVQAGGRGNPPAAAPAAPAGPKGPVIREVPNLKLVSAKPCGTPRWALLCQRVKRRCRCPKAPSLEDDHVIARQRRMYARLLFVVVGIFSPFCRVWRWVRQPFHSELSGALAWPDAADIRSRMNEAIQTRRLTRRKQAPTCLIFLSSSRLLTSATMSPSSTASWKRR